MKIRSILFLCCLISGFKSLHAQGSAFMCTTPLAEQIMLGNYDPTVFSSGVVITNPDSISQGILQRVNADTLKSNILKLASFENRNTGSDTLSATRGFGAARNWVHSKFQQYSAENENRLIPSFFQFDQIICGVGRHKNIIAVLPGSDTTDKSIVLIQGHMDSRCEDLCDTACSAQGVEDNATGTALVMELARIMSKYTYKHTLVFMINTSEEQGLYGAEAFADYLQLKGIQIYAAQNNDVIGGIICGATSSAPSCPGLNNIDSLQVRLFSYGGFNSKHKQFARFSKLEYQEQIVPHAPVVMTMSIMSPEDRTGRGGDHIPFRQHGDVSIRYTSANEHGNANVADTLYADRQHSTRDTLGVDTDMDMVIDSFFVDFNYLARNTVINGNTAAMAAIGPKTPDFTATAIGINQVAVQITLQTQYDNYRFAFRTTTTDWDSVYTMTGITDTFTISPATSHFVSVASVDSLGVESLFSKEILLHVATGIDEFKKTNGVSLLPNKPNPFDESTIISVYVEDEQKYKDAVIRISELSGKEIKNIPVTLDNGMNEVLYEHGYNASGTFMYSLIVDGKVIESRKMVFSN
jgi:hypothetical protein